MPNADKLNLIQITLPNSKFCAFILMIYFTKICFKDCNQYWYLKQNWEPLHYSYLTETYFVNTNDNGDCEDIWFHVSNPIRTFLSESLSNSNVIIRAQENEAQRKCVLLRAERGVYSESHVFHLWVMWSFHSKHPFTDNNNNLIINLDMRKWARLYNSKNIYALRKHF